MHVIGHRGAGGLAVENTMSAIKAALKAHVWGVELDVRISQDGVLFLSHADTVQPANGKAMKISQTHSRDLQTIRLLQNEQLLTAEAAIKLVCKSDNTTMIMLDLKGKKWSKVVRQFIEKLPQHQQARCILASFNLKELREVQRQLPRILYCYHYHAMPMGLQLLAARKLDAWGVGISMHTFNRVMVRAARNLNLHIVAFTVNSPKKARALERAHVEFIISDFPDRFAILEQ